MEVSLEPTVLQRQRSTTLRRLPVSPHITHHCHPNKHQLGQAEAQNLNPLQSNWASDEESRVAASPSSRPPSHLLPADGNVLLCCGAH